MAWQLCFSYCHAAFAFTPCSLSSSHTFFLCLLHCSFPFALCLLACWLLEKTRAGLLCSQLEMCYLDLWLSSIKMSNVGAASCPCPPLPCACGGRNGIMVIYSIVVTILSCSLRCQTGFKLNSGFRSRFVGGMQQKYLVCHVLLKT